MSYYSSLTGSHLAQSACGRAAFAGLRCRSVALFLLLAVLLLGGASGCGGHQWQLQLTVSTDANSNSPVIFSVVLPKSQPIYKKLMDMTAKQWFAQREQLLRDNRKELEETYYEFVPGQQIPEIAQKVSRGVITGLIFVNYQSAGVHRYTFETTTPLKISFGQRAVSFSP